MHDTRLPSEGRMEIYFDKLIKALAARSGGIFFAEAKVLRQRSFLAVGRRQL